MGMFIGDYLMPKNEQLILNNNYLTNIVSLKYPGILQVIKRFLSFNRLYFKLTNVLSFHSNILSQI